MSGSGVCGAFSAEQMALPDIEMEVTETIMAGKGRKTVQMLKRVPTSKWK